MMIILRRGTKIYNNDNNTKKKKKKRGTRFIIRSMIRLITTRITRRRGRGLIMIQSQSKLD